MHQRSNEWYAARRAKFTASENHKLCNPKGLGETGMTYIRSKIAEHFGAYEEESFAKSMQWGIDYEQEAADCFTSYSFLDICEVGFLEDKDFPEVGCSPDRIVKNQNKGVEIKCPYVPANHIENLMLKTADDLKKVHKEYYWQIMTCLLVTGCESWYFVSYHPKFSDDHRIKVLEIFRNESDISFLKVRLNEAIALKQEIINSI